MAETYIEWLLFHDCGSGGFQKRFISISRVQYQHRRSSEGWNPGCALGPKGLNIGAARQVTYWIPAFAGMTVGNRRLPGRCLVVPLMGDLRKIPIVRTG
jgi:hypothetical protein